MFRPQTSVRAFDGNGGKKKEQCSQSALMSLVIPVIQTDSLLQKVCFCTGTKKMKLFQLSSMTTPSLVGQLINYLFLHKPLNEASETARRQHWGPIINIPHVYFRPMFCTITCCRFSFCRHNKSRTRRLHPRDAVQGSRCSSLFSPLYKQLMNSGAVGLEPGLVRGEPGKPDFF